MANPPPLCAQEALGDLRESYPFVCCRCGTGQELTPGRQMQKGINSGLLMCTNTRCRALLHVWVVPDLATGTEALSELQTTHIARMRRVQRQVQDGGY